MNNLYNIIKYDYLQRVRSYRFLIICCFSLAFAYLLVPAPDANYTTIRLSKYIGNYNSSWVAYTSAIITSMFLGLIGFYLINGGLKKDLDTGIGQIFSATGVSNQTYLIAKLLSSFSVLMTILLLIMLMSIGMFFGFNKNQPFELTHFLKAYALIPLPTLFFTAAISVFLEVLIIKKTVIQNIAVYALFILIIGIQQKGDPKNAYLDFFGITHITSAMITQVEELVEDEANVVLNIGFIVSSNRATERFEFIAPNIDVTVIMSRLGIIVISFFGVFILAPFFHRFDLKQTIKESSAKISSHQSTTLQLAVKQMPKVNFSASILPLIKMELLMHFKQTSRWLLFIILGLMVAMTFAPISVAHPILLPITWFLLLNNLSGLITKEKTYNMHYFAFSSFEPIKRLLSAQLISGFILVLLVAIPLLIRLLITNSFSALHVLLGATLLVFGAGLSGALSGGKRLFEVLFFFISYMALNKLPIADYFGGFHDGLPYTALLFLLSSTMIVLLFIIRKKQIRHS